MVFNVDFPKLKCEYLHIQATNFMGTRKAGIATKVPEVGPDSPDGPIHLTVTPPRRAREQVNLYHLDRDGALLAKHVSSGKMLRHADTDDERGADAAAPNATLETHALTAANFDYLHRTHPAGLFVAFCVPGYKLCQVGTTDASPPAPQLDASQPAPQPDASPPAPQLDTSPPAPARR